MFLEEQLLKAIVVGSKGVGLSHVRILKMTARFLAIGLCAGLLLAINLPAQTAGGWQLGKLVAIEAHPEGRFFDWGNRTVRLYDGYPYYDLTILLGERDYVVRYEGTGNYFPSAWKIGDPIRLRLNHGQMELVEYGDSIVSTRVMDKFKPKLKKMADH